MSDQNVDNNSSLATLASIKRTLVVIAVILGIMLVLEWGPKICNQCEGNADKRQQCRFCNKTGFVWAGRVFYGGSPPW